MPAVIVIHTAAKTGAVLKNLTKYCIKFLQKVERDYLKLKEKNSEVECKSLLNNRSSITEEKR
jgi:hypothetical protein